MFGRLLQVEVILAEEELNEVAGWVEAMDLDCYNKCMGKENPHDICSKRCGLENVERIVIKVSQSKVADILIRCFQA